jgi:hypothetical protein
MKPLWAASPRPTFCSASVNFRRCLTYREPSRGASLSSVVPRRRCRRLQGSVALDIQQIAYFANGRCVEFTRSVYRSDTFDFVPELTPSPSSTAGIEGALR